MQKIFFHKTCKQYASKLWTISDSFVAFEKLLTKGSISCFTLFSVPLPQRSFLCCFFKTTFTTKYPVLIEPLVKIWKNADSGFYKCSISTVVSRSSVFCPHNSYSAHFCAAFLNYIYSMLRENDYRAVKYLCSL